MSKSTLPKLPSLPSSSKPASLAPCRCGCGGSTASTFVPGHDSRLKGLLIRALRVGAPGGMTLDEIEAWGGPGVRAAVVRGLADSALLRRWKIEVPEPVEVESDAEVAS